MRVILFVTLFLCLPMAAQSAVDGPPAALADKIAPNAWRKVQSGEARDLIILFDASAVDADVRAGLNRRKRTVDDDQALAQRADGYRQVKLPLMGLLKPEEAETRRDYTHLPLVLMRFSGTAGLERLLTDNRVLAVYEDRRLYANLAESLPLIGQPPVAGIMGRTGAGATVAVLDTGVTYTRSEFGSCTAPGVPAGCRVVVAMDIATDDGQLDSIGHGTEVAGTVLGVAPKANIAALDVFSGNSALSSDIIAGINWAIANRSPYNIKAINMSLGDGVDHTSACTSRSDPFATPIQNARNAGMVVVVAAGNEGRTDGLSSPACVAEAVSVGAVYDAAFGSLAWSGCTDTNITADKVTCFSNSASFLDLLAPGALITVTGATVAGTSFSAPMVAGAIAVLGAAFPTETPAQLEARLSSTGKAVTDSRNGITKPRINLLAAMGAPANDAFAAATVLNGDNGTSTGWNFNAGKETGEPNHAGVSGGVSVWWQWTAGATGTATLDTHGSGFNTLLAVYSGSSIPALTAVASNNDDGSSGGASGLSFHAVAGTSYHIAVDGSGGATGSIALNRSFSTDEADLEVNLTDTPDPVTVGQTLTYTIVVANHGPSAAEGVVVTQTLPAGAAFLSAGSGCSQSLGTVTCSLGSLANAAQASINVQVTATAAGTLSSAADVSAATADNNMLNNTAATATTANASGGSSGGSDSGDGDLPLPAWALAALGAGLLEVLRRRG